MLSLATGGDRAVSAESGPGDLTLQAPPSYPMLPIQGRDLHLTLLILPPLRGYASQVRNGLKSRSWNDSHDGLSFKIEKIGWIDEGAERGEERGGEARRKRMRTMAGWRSMATGPPLRLNLVDRSVRAMKPAVVGA